MTTIASFATFTCANTGGKRSIDSVYILADSKWSWPGYSQPNMQKIFYSREAKFVMSYLGDARLGFEVLTMITFRASTDPSIRGGKSMEAKISRVKVLLDYSLATFPLKERIHDAELFGIFYFQKELKAYSFFAKSNERAFNMVERTISDQTNIYASGSGGKIFLKKYDIARDRNRNVSEAAVYFNSFVQFLKSAVDKQSSVPPQAVVISTSGEVKPVSIKLGSEFYKLGSIDNERANYKKEIDYRDEQFEFLHSDGRIKGVNRKRYHIV